MSFAQSLDVGRVGESLIAGWLKSRGVALMPAYEIEKSCGKGPQLFAQESSWIAPDMLVFATSGALWIEAKHKSVWTWYRRSCEWTTGIDIRHYEDYQRVRDRTKLPVWLLFFHRESAPAACDMRFHCPLECPTGLFGNDLDMLATTESHRAPSLSFSRDGNVGHGSSGMVYWAHRSLRELATKEAVLRSQHAKAA